MILMKPSKSISSSSARQDTCEWEDAQPKSCTACTCLTPASAAFTGQVSQHVWSIHADALVITHYICDRGMHCSSIGPQLRREGDYLCTLHPQARLPLHTQFQQQAASLSGHT